MTSRPEWVQKLTVVQPLTIQTVVVYFHATDNISGAQIMIMDATLAATATPVDTINISSISSHSAAQLWGVYPNIVTVNTTLQPGTYCVGLYNPRTRQRTCCTRSRIGSSYYICNSG